MSAVSFASTSNCPMLNRAASSSSISSSSSCCCFTRWLASVALAGPHLAGPPHFPFNVAHSPEFRLVILIWFFGQALAKAQSVIAKLARENAALKQGLNSSQHQLSKGGGTARARSASPPPRRSFGAASGFDSPQPQVSSIPSPDFPSFQL